MASELDYADIFLATPNPYMVLGTDFVIRCVNRAYTQLTGLPREELVGRHIFEAFPANPADPGAVGARNLDTSLHRVLATGRPDTMGLQRYDVPMRDASGKAMERWWSGYNTPIFGSDGTITGILHRVEDMTEFARYGTDTPILAGEPGEPGSEPALAEGERFERARELLRLNEELQEAHAREREVAVTLQEAMLQAPDLARHRDIAVRYRPAAGALNVCGDWYDVVDLSPDRFSVGIGDVVGHGLEAASVMGMLRSALSAAVRALQSPAQALDVLGLYARSLEGAMATTAAKVLIDTSSEVITYSSAGHPPPVLVHADGTHELLDQATDPALGVRIKDVPQPQASLAYGADDTLVLYTDGLIERRNEDIDVGLTRLTDAVTEGRTLPAEDLADTLLDRLVPATGAADDIALVVVRL
ncbi:SpoIIE family protein phosphatase [Actinomadura rayongensis]|uniref:SpoIIE family protein phosphatase n=1 Tax=Actinomadura rayongensis TaxID=1429076 RepID=A0A6I4W8U8_9ACTN|nr:SpoIIE family protein phosphatase [Actinomadura rayongensis]MXQ65981.1 SpoIIE family protein phosphatase [Actinomadura rayongensis]